MCLKLLYNIIKCWISCSTSIFLKKYSYPMCIPRIVSGLHVWWLIALQTLFCIHYLVSSFNRGILEWMREICWRVTIGNLITVGIGKSFFDDQGCMGLEITRQSSYTIWPSFMNPVLVSSVCVTVKNTTHIYDLFILLMISIHSLLKVFLSSCMND